MNVGRRSSIVQNGGISSLVPRPLPCNSLRKRHKTRATNDEKGLGDELLDFMYAGKKLRKWYGEQDLVLPKDGGDPVEEWKEDPSNDTVPRDKVAILFPEESPMAEQVLLQLILLRAPVLVVTKNVAQAKAAYGSYVDVAKADSLPSSLKAAKAVVMCGPVSNKSISMLNAAKVPYTVLLSGAVATSGQSVFSALFASSETKELSSLSRETLVKESGVPYTIVRVDPQMLSNLPGGSMTLTAAKVSVREEEGTSSSGNGNVPREDVALYLAMSAMELASRGDTCIVQLSSGQVASPTMSVEERGEMVQKLLLA